MIFLDALMIVGTILLVALAFLLLIGILKLAWAIITAEKPTDEEIRKYEEWRKKNK